MIATGGMSGVTVLAKSAVTVNCPADITEDILATITVPAGAMGPNGYLRVSTVWSCTNNANVKTARLRFGGIGGTVYASISLASQNSVFDIRQIANRNSQSSQVGGQAGSLAFGLSTNAPQASNVDTSAATTIVLTGQKATAGDTLTLESYLVELVYGA